jgi:very-short-patch-repair endonuclease/predicted transcriptional regulator of viral defense system
MAKKGSASPGAGANASGVWALAHRQHGVVTRSQLLDLGFTNAAIYHRLRSGRLHRIHRGVFALGRPLLDKHGRWIAAVLAHGQGAVLSHRSAAELWELSSSRRAPIEVSIPADLRRRVRGITTYRRRTLGEADRTIRHGIPTTRPARTLADLTTCLTDAQLEAAINEADKRSLIDPESLRAAADEMNWQPGTSSLKRLLDRRTFALTDSDLERRFLALVRGSGLITPETGIELNGFRVDFYWPDLGLVVETDGLRYHRTPAQQARDRLRDQRHTAAGLTTLRFTHAQVRFEPAYVRRTLTEVARRLRQD